MAPASTSTRRARIRLRPGAMAGERPCGGRGDPTSAPHHLEPRYPFPGLWPGESDEGAQEVRVAGRHGLMAG